MAFFDKLKEVKESVVQGVNSASQAAKEKYEADKKAREEKKAAEEAYKAEMKEKANNISEKIVNDICANDENSSNLFAEKDKNEVLKFTKEFFEKILLPANSKEKSYISMYPYISGKLSEKISKTFDESIPCDSIIMYIGDRDGQEFILTYDKFYFKMLLEEDKKFQIIGSVLTTKLNMFSLRKDTDFYVFMCNDVEVANIKINAGKETDFISLNKYFTDIKNGDYVITNEEVDAIIREKIGASVVTEIENESDTGEMLEFFTYNSSGGYVACTTEKIIIADKQSGGNVSSVSRYYYDELRTVETKQEATDLGGPVSGSLGGLVVEMVVQVAVESAIDSLLKDVCDLEIRGDGIYKKMSGMVKVEADRIVAIFNKYKKEKRNSDREERVQPQIAVQEQQNQTDVFEQLEKLAKLKEAGILSEEEFNTKKAALLDKI